MRLSCRSVRRVLALIPGHDLDVDTDAAVRAHIADCPACRAKLAPWVRQRRMLREFGAATAAAAPAADAVLAGLQEQVLTAVAEARVADREAAATRRVRVHAGLRAVAAVLLVGLGLWLGTSSARDRNAPLDGLPELAGSQPHRLETSDALRPVSAGRFWGLGGRSTLMTLGDESIATQDDLDEFERLHGEALDDAAAACPMVDPWDDVREALARLERDSRR